MSKFKIEVISFAQTFLSSFLTVLAIAISQFNAEDYAEFLSSSFWAGVILASARTAIKMAWRKTLPESIGGVK